MKTKKNDHVFIVSRGSAAVRGARHTVTGANGRRYHTWRLRYHLDGLQRPTFPDEADARAEAERIALIIANGRTIADNLSPEDTASFARARQILASHNIAKPLELVAAEYCDLIKTKTPDPKHQTPFPEIVTAFLEQKERDGTRWRYRKELKHRLEFLQKHIHAPLANLIATDITKLLDDLQKENQWSNRSRNHYRAALSNLCTFARGRYVPRTWNEMEYVEKFKEADGKIIIWTPDEVDHLFTIAQKKMPKIVPVLAVMFFVGHRHSETTGTPEDKVPPLDWRDLNLESGHGFLEEGKVRTAGNRITYIPPNARAWLKQYCRPAGPICPYKNLNNQIQKLCVLAKINWKGNAARRSYISYRLAQTRNLPMVSEETGTSISTLQKRYRRPVPLTEARRYFNIRPVREVGRRKILELKTEIRRQKDAKKKTGSTLEKRVRIVKTD